MSEKTRCDERSDISNKGKRRIVFLPEKLRILLRRYAGKQKKTAGAVFTTRMGKPLEIYTLERVLRNTGKFGGGGRRPSKKI